MKILIVKPSSLGDVIHALPVLRLLKRHWPASEIHWWIEAGIAPLLAGDPDLSGRFQFDRRAWQHPRVWPAEWRNLLDVRSRRFDLVLDLQGLSRSAFFAWLANGAQTIGLDNPREGRREGAQMFYDRLAPPSPPGTPAPERYLNILRALGLPAEGEFEWLPPRPAAAAAVAKIAEGRPGRLVALLPGARWDNKRWPAAYFASTVKRLSDEFADANFLILGAASDQILARTIVAAKPDRCLDLTGRTSLSELIEWLRRATLVIANDTGPLHIAAALNRPLVPIYGPSDARATGPHGQMDRVLQARHLTCVPCLKQTCSNSENLACLHAITPEMVCAQARLTLHGPLATLRN